jgi:hypothetical protein
MKTEREAREQETRELHNQLEKAQQEIDTLHTTALASEEKHRAELQQVQDRLTLDCEKRLLQLEKDYQGQLQQVCDDYNQQVRELFRQLQQGSKKTPTNEKQKAP